MAIVLQNGLVQAAQLVQSNGAKKKLKLIVVHPTDAAILINENSSKIFFPRASMKDGEFTLGASDMLLQTFYGPVPIKQSVFCPVHYACLISPESWVLGTSGKPGLMDFDGLTARTVYNADELESRLAAYNIFLACRAPGWNGLCRLQ